MLLSYTPNAVVELLPHNIFVKTTACAVYCLACFGMFSNLLQLFNFYACKMDHYEEGGGVGQINCLSDRSTAEPERSSPFPVDFLALTFNTSMCYGCNFFCYWSALFLAILLICYVMSKMVELQRRRHLFSVQCDCTASLIALHLVIFESCFFEDDGQSDDNNKNNFICIVRKW